MEFVFISPITSMEHSGVEFHEKRILAAAEVEPDQIWSSQEIDKRKLQEREEDMFIQRSGKDYPSEKIAFHP